MAAGTQVSRNVRNALIAAIVPLPSLAFYALFLHSYSAAEEALGWWGFICRWGSQHPIALLNALFFVNVNVIFWFISLLQHSTWLIDVYWTVLPVMIAHYAASHPSSKSDRWRSRVVLSLVWLWSVRLTHSYFRRENWNWGEREDWRFAELRSKHKKHWWWLSFFLVYVSQQVFIVGICLPLFTTHNSTQPWSIHDNVSAVVCLCGIAIAYLADTKLHTYVRKNTALKAIGATAVPVLEEGVWYHSRHPNYFGEQLWWWGLAMFSWELGHGWDCIGAAINSTCLAYCTVLVERKMLSVPSRAAKYRQYQRTTSVWIPWFKRSPSTAETKVH